MYKLLAVEESCDAKMVKMNMVGQEKGIFHVCGVTMS